MLRRLVLAALTIAIAACAPGAAGTQVLQTTPRSRDYNIVYVQGVTGNPFFTSLTCGARREAVRLGNVKFDYQGGQNYSPEAQTPVLNAVIAKRPDAIIISPMAGQAMVQPLSQAKEAGIILVFADTTAADASLAVSEVASDNTEGGRLAAERLAALLNGKGKVLIEGAIPGISTADERLHGFEVEIERYPDISLIGVQYSQSDPGKATSQISAMLAAHPDLAGIFAVSTQEVEGAATALINAGKQGEVKLVGFDTSPPILEHVQAGVVQGLVVQEPAEMGKIAMQQAVAALSGRSTTPSIKTPVVFLTRDNMRDRGIAEFVYKTTCQ
jgi:ribose transport system substrate-binding protein